MTSPELQLYEQYKALFDEQPKQNGTKEAETRAGRALTYALDIRKFEIDLYWKRATYFWTFIGAAFAAYALTYKTASEHEPWLSVIFSALGLVFSFAWYLVNRGSKFWQNNWEHHVDLLEDITLGPLYKIIVKDMPSTKSCFNKVISAPKTILTAPGQFSVTKINQILSVFVVAIWVLLFIKSILPASMDLSADYYKITIILVTPLFMGLLYYCGRSSNEQTEQKDSEFYLYKRGFKIKV